jgi:hypothetical protein
MGWILEISRPRGNGAWVRHGLQHRNLPIGRLYGPPKAGDPSPVFPSATLRDAWLA